MSDEPTISVVIPALNEARWLPPTLAALREAVATFESEGLGVAEVLVVDNASGDGTAEVARAGGARVVEESRRGIGYARNAGARAAKAPVIFFLDADTIVPPTVLVEIARTLEDPDCIGGAVATHYKPKKRTLKPYMAMWRWWARTFKMTQGISQFARAEAFEAVGGYDTARQMAEDTKFNWRLRALARKRGQRVELITEVAVEPSCRRLDEWPVWKTVLMTNPLTTQLFPRSRWFWRGWGDKSVR